MKKERGFLVSILVLSFCAVFSACSDGFDYREGPQILKDYVAFGSSAEGEVYGNDRVVQGFTIQEIVSHYSEEAVWTDDVIRNTNEIVITRESAKIKGAEEMKSPSFISVYYTDYGQLRRLSVFSGQGQYTKRIGRYRISVTADLFCVYEDESLIYTGHTS
ncbi:MAG: hypothetical protein LBR70_00610 [Lactobacillaceae bacterium]|jgi:hypothetical protein|nr:hypothetical protein [Lactobacillaceae bacterium]